VTVGQFDAGVRNNIIPDRARLVGTIRTFDEAMRDDIHARVRNIAEGIAQVHGATATVTVERGYPVTINDPKLTETMLPTLERIAPGRVLELPKITGAEDFSYFANKVPGLFLIVGVTPKDQMATAAINHSPRFFIDEGALPDGAKALARMTADWLFANAK
jgi:amidohydrolase